MLGVMSRTDSLANADPYPSEVERRADVWVHVVGLGIATVGFVLLVTLSAFSDPSPGEFVAVSVYAAGVFLMWLSSTLYNVARSPARRRALRRIDHAAIFMLIACTYTPFTSQCLDGAWAIGMTVGVWVVALAGIVIKLVVHDPPKGLSIAAYLACGWIAVVAIGPLSDGVPRPALLLLALGGVVYSAGAAVYAATALPFRRAIWHGFVMVAAGLHWVAVLIGVVAPVIHTSQVP